MTTGDDSSEETLALSSQPEALRRQPRRAGRLAATRFTPGTLLGGRFRVVSLLGRGGMGEVYRADDLKLGQAVALKFLPRDARSARDRERLVQEVRIGREIAHPNVCRLYDVVELDGQLFIVMEYVDGEDLASLLRRIDRLQAEKALSVARDVSAGLAAAHEKGIVHRDLKPANIMLDGRGRARITDFGLATPGDEAGRAEPAGTPAYMAPEQLAGGGASVRTDIYAFGLVLFELFTGQRAIEATTLAEITQQQLELSERSLSQLAPGIDPTIERAILACLAIDPDARPGTVSAVAAALPERDPLAAMLAAGETPSPVIVADSATVGDLSHGAAWSALGVFLLCLFATARLQSEMLEQRVPLPKPAEVLRERAREIAASVLPSSLQPVDDALTAAADRGRLRHAARWPLLEAPNPFQFLYRQSPTPLAPTNRERRVLWNDPPHDVPGRVGVRLDAEQRLIELIAVPPAVEETAAPEAEPDFASLLAAAGLDADSLRPVAPAWAAPVDSDAKRAWWARYPGVPRDVRVEAASYHGRPVWFAVLMPWEFDATWGTAASGGASSLAARINILFLIALPAAAFLLARLNLRRRQGDTRGALVLGVTIFGSLLVAALFRADHFRGFVDEWALVSQMIAETAFWGAMAALMYVAAEPFIRKRWPEMLISWSRLVAGRWRNPMVGRDLLLGLAGGVLVGMLWHLIAFLPEWLGREDVLPMTKALTPLASPRHVGHFLARGIAEALLRAIGFAFFLVLLRNILRRQWLAASVATLLVGLSVLNLTAGPLALRLAFALIAAGLGVVTLTRFGLLSLAAFSYATLLLVWLRIGIDPSTWYFGRSVLVLLVLATMAIGAFFISVGSKGPLPRALWQE